MKKKVIIAVLLIIIAAIIGVFALYSHYNSAMDSSNETMIDIRIEEGATTTSIASDLYENKLISSEFGFKLISKLKGYDGKYQVGLYELNQSMTATDIMEKLSSGAVKATQFTIVEGTFVKNIAAQAAELGLCSKKEFMKEVKSGKFDYDFLKDAPKGETRLEGFLLPETYSIPDGASAHEIIDIILSNFNEQVGHKYDKQAKKLGLSFYELLTVASIIEREAVFEEDDANVSSVIYNRLKDGMALQMDSSLSYIYNDNTESHSLKDLEVDNPYNTYKYKGLPPGPISNPGIAAIEAAANPADTDYLFFVNSKKLDGSLAFAKTDSGFMKLFNEYSEALAKQEKEEN
ncbi:MAG: endolytic transglycosylase MltG [Clostridia bacterium]|nr:endolytic transglycosylase MltG [Clostridia bacterium]